MKKEMDKCYESYPGKFVILTNLLTIIIYLIGLFIISKIGVIWAVLFLIYILILEYRLLSSHCVDCYYYGKTCAFGKGKISSLLFKRGNNKNFCKKNITWKTMIPDILVFLIPFIVGIVLLIVKFDWFILVLLIILLILNTIVNSLVRGKIACKYCKQRKIGCPAYKLFEKNERR